MISLAKANTNALSMKHTFQRHGRLLLTARHYVKTFYTLQHTSLNYLYKSSSTMHYVKLLQYNTMDLQNVVIMWFVCCFSHFQGGYMQAKIQKLQEQCTKEQKRASSNIFSGVSIFVNGYTSKLTSLLLGAIHKEYDPFCGNI